MMRSKEGWGQVRPRMSEGVDEHGAAVPRTGRPWGWHARPAPGLERRKGYNRRDYYYTRSWQIIQECCGDEIDPEDMDDIVTARKAEYVWGTRYIDAPVLRWHDDDDDGTPGNDDEEELYYCNDANMNVTAVVGESGGTWQVLERYLYDAYGRPRICNADWSDTAVTWANSKKNEILFCGYRYDPETGLYHVRHRPDHPTLGRWMVRDFEGYVRGMSLYEYVTSEPVGLLDPYGLSDMTVEEVKAARGIVKSCG